MVVFFSQTLGAIFSRIFRDFAQIINKSKLFGVRFLPCTPASYSTGYSCWLDTISRTGDNGKVISICPVKIPLAKEMYASR